MKKLHLLACAILLNLAAAIGSNISEYDKQFFIDSYAYQAITEMEYSGIPASVTMAQAILESGWGKGTIAKNANNYFCIKCHNWDGETFKAKDDEPGLSCFRKYETALQSFKDHTDFLKNGKRYQPLFRLDKKDFRGWCKGLKKYGYATDPAYANKLISLIENYGLWVFDLAVPTMNKPTVEAPHQEPEEKMDNALVAQADQENDIPLNTNHSRVREDATTTLAVPFYHFKTSESVHNLAQPESIYKPQPIKKRKMKIRPILPHSNVHFDNIE